MHLWSTASRDRSIPLLVLLFVSCTGAIGDGTEPTRRPAVPTGEGASSLGGGATGMTPGMTGLAPKGGIGPGGGPSGVALAPTVDMTPRGGIRRLGAVEYDATVRDLLGDPTGGSHLILPDDSRTPFDNDYTNQTSSKTLVEGVELLAADAAGRLLKDTKRRAQVVGCVPAAAKDDICLKSFVTAFGRRALRRPMGDDEVTRFMALGSLGQMANDFYVSVNAVVRAFLQHPSFLHRIEIGTPVPGQAGVYKLSEDEIAARLSYLLWGTMPSAALFDLADRKRLGTSEGVRAAATDMMADPRTRERIKRFHAMWIGFEELKQAPELASAMRAETSALLDRVIFEDQRPWQDIFRMDETFVSDALAKHYGIPGPGGTQPKWVKWGNSGRRGLLSQGSFLQVGTKANDSSPTMRGLFVRRNLLCQPIASPPPGVSADDVPPVVGGDACKKTRYAVHDQGGCAACHTQMDPIGFGLEAYDKEGRFRTFEVDHPECPISGEGEMVGVGRFKGPGELATRALESGLLNSCVVEQLHRFASGRTNLEDLDQALVARLAERAGKKDFRFDTLLLDLVASPTFLHRRED